LNGYKVLVVDRARFPSDTVCTHHDLTLVIGVARPHVRRAGRPDPPQHPAARLHGPGGAQPLDGFITGPNVGVGNGMGDDGDRLHDWRFDAKTETDGAIVDEIYGSTGAVRPTPS
jgi:hypothetical protein